MLPAFSRSYWVNCVWIVFFSAFHRVLMSAPRFYWVLMSVTRFEWVLPNFPSFLLRFPCVLTSAVGFWLEALLVSFSVFIGFLCLCWERIKVLGNPTKLHSGLVCDLPSVQPISISNRWLVAFDGREFAFRYLLTRRTRILALAASRFLIGRTDADGHVSGVNDAVSFAYFCIQRNTHPLLPKPRLLSTFLLAKTSIVFLKNIFARQWNQRKVCFFRERKTGLGAEIDETGVNEREKERERES